MLVSLFFRLLRFLITGIICSLPIYFDSLGVVKDNGILFISFMAYVFIMGYDTYNFSFTFWEKKHYYLGLLLPLGIYIIMGFLTCLFLPPVVFNRIFLPLRFAGGFGLRTIESIPVISMIIIVVLTVLRFFGARAGRLFLDNFLEEEEEL